MFTTVIAPAGYTVRSLSQGFFDKERLMNDTEARKHKVEMRETPDI